MQLVLTLKQLNLVDIQEKKEPTKTKVDLAGDDAKLVAVISTFLNASFRRRDRLHLELLAKS